MFRRNIIKKQNRLFLMLFFPLTVSLVFLPFDFSNHKLGISDVESSQIITIDKDTVWHKTDDLVFDKSITITNGATLTILKGSVIKFKNFVELTITDGARIIAEGTNDEKIIFTTTDYGIYSIDFSKSNQNKPSIFRFVEFQNGGIRLILAQKNLSDKALASSTEHCIPGLQIYNSQVHIENSIFTKNNCANILSAYIVDDELENPESDEPMLAIVNSNFEKSSGYSPIPIEAICKKSKTDNSSPCLKKIILKNNWYEKLDELEESEYERISRQITLDGFRKNNLIVDPTIIVPGIMGSWKISNEWKLDPILKTYSNLIVSLKENGLEKNINLFEFPYEWRNSNVLTGNQLQSKIQEIKEKTKSSKVNLIAHSMGGLVARSYIEDKNYANDVNQLITLGTPHRGSPEAYLKWEAGEGFFSIKDKLAKKLFQLEALHSGYLDLKKYIQEKILSVKELLPDYDYLYEASEKKMRSYGENYPQNDFLENLNKKSNLAKLKKINLVNIIGDTGKNETIKNFRITESSKSEKWKHGMPENFYNKQSDQGIEYGKGDETVPFSSAQDISADKEIEIDSAHNDLPTKAQCEIFQSLSGKANCEYIDTFKIIKNILNFNVFSPIDIQIISPSGKRAGKDFETGEILDEIEGAFYSGYDTENEFLIIPNPEDGEYKILTQGTGDGKYTIETIQIKEFADGIRERTIISPTGETFSGKTETFSLNFDDIDFQNEEQNEEEEEEEEEEASENQSQENDSDKKKKNAKSKNKKEETKEDIPMLATVANNPDKDIFPTKEVSFSSKKDEPFSQIKNQKKDLQRQKISKLFLFLLLIPILFIVFLFSKNKK